MLHFLHNFFKCLNLRLKIFFGMYITLLTFINIAEYISYAINQQLTDNNLIL